MDIFKAVEFILKAPKLVKAFMEVLKGHDPIIKFWTMLSVPTVLLVAALFYLGLTEAAKLITLVYITLVLSALVYKYFFPGEKGSPKRNTDKGVYFVKC